MPKSLLIVESPAKSKTIAKYLGPDFTVLASYGHLRDLPIKKGKPVDPDQDFKITYEVTEDHIRHVNAIVTAAKHASTIYLATDMDREGEAISWHIAEILKERGITGKTMHRVTFTEITKKAILDAVAHPRELLIPLVDAQQARRALDYLVGFNLSPVLWKKVKSGLSAGRVQSPALRLIVEREDEIDAFNPQEHWSIHAMLEADGTPFKSKLVKLYGKKFEQFDLPNETVAKAAQEDLRKHAGFFLTVASREAKERQRKPYPPFTTSTLQQDAANRLGFNSQRTMRIAQGLYEGINLGGEQVGLITYMRTDAVNLSEEAIADIRKHIDKTLGSQYLPVTANRYQTKSKNAQEAHEAIRPSSVDRTPEAMAKFLDDDQLKLYRLIWQRAVACQMANAIMNTLTLEFHVPTPQGESTFRSNGSTVKFPGFLKVYAPHRDDADDEAKLPYLKEGDRAIIQRIEAEQHFTEPPPRFNEGSIVKTLEELGIGRPSTFASIIEVLKRREYVRMDGRKFVPTEVGRAVGHFLSKNFEPYVDYQFTAKLEDDLDAVSRGERNWKELMREFWAPFIAMIKDKIANASRQEARGRRFLGNDPTSGKPIHAFVSRFGGTVAIGDLEHDKKDKNAVRFASLAEGQHVETVTLDEALVLLAYPRDLGDGVSLNRGRNGFYVRQGETSASLAEGQYPDTLTLQEAKALIEERKNLVANRFVKVFEGTGIQILNGKYGQYVTDGKINATLPAGKPAADYTLEEAKDLLEKKAAQGPSKGHGGGFKKGKGKWKGKSSGGSGKGFGGKRRSSGDDLPL